MSWTDSDPRENHIVRLSEDTKEVDLTVEDEDGNKKVVGTAKMTRDGRIIGNITDSFYANLFNTWRPGDFSIGIEDDILEQGERIVSNVFDQDYLGP